MTQRYFPLLNEGVNISVKLIWKDHGISESEMEALEVAQRRISREAHDVLMDFLQEHHSSIAGLYFMNDSYVRKWLDNEKLASLLGQVTEPYQQTIFYSSLKQRIDASVYQPGKSIFEIQSDRTPDRTAFSTTEWAGSFYLIDFWGSWCLPCIADFPNLKSLKNKFPDELRILGIASDKEEAWRPAIDRHGLDWQHILIGNGDQDFATRLNVTGYPTKILVDPNGVIVYRGTGGGEDSFLKMAELIENWH